jgi:hypothetical protein
MNNLIVNRFDNPFGPAGSAAGWGFMLGGLLITYFSYLGIFIILTGAFLAFTHTSVIIDKSDKKVKLTNNFFGILKFGRWLDIRPEMFITVRPNNIVFRTYSRSNRSTDIKTHNYRLILVDENKKNIVPLKNVNTLNEARANAEELSMQLGIDVNI